MRMATKVLAATLALVVAGGAGAVAARTVLPVSPDNEPATAGRAAEAGTAALGSLGAGTTEGRVVGITPCRIVDTRKSPAGPLQVGVARTFDVRGGGAAFVVQGGTAGGCDIPVDATLVEATVTAVDAGSGFLRVWPAGRSQPNATFLNYDDAFNVSTTGSLTLCGADGSTCSSTQDLTARAYGSPTHLVIDVQAYVVPPMSVLMNADGTVVRSSRVVTVQKQATGRYAIAFDRDVTSCTYAATVSTPDAGLVDGFATVTNFASSDAAVFVRTFTAEGAEADRPFSLDVTC
ncbi:MAG: hypothetical protein R2702_06215 [Acidimicrobiales bacterium]